MKRIITILFLVIISFLSIAQTTKSNADELEKLNTRIEVLEGQKDNLNKQSELLEKDFELKKKNLDNQFSENKIQIDKDLSGFRNLMYTLGAGVLGLLLVYFVYIRNFIKRKSEEIAEKKINEVIETVVEKNRDKIVSLIESQDVELKVKKENNILVISELENDREFIREFFNEVGIRNFKFVGVERYKPIPADVDLVVFDDRRITNEHHDLYNEYLKRSPDKLLFVFFGDRFNAVKRDNLNYANSKYTLYNQIVNSLKFNEIRKT